jgi:predicted outer membrane protein
MNSAGSPVAPRGSVLEATVFRKLAFSQGCWIVVTAGAVLGCAPAMQPGEGLPATAPASASGIAAVFAANQAAIESAGFALERASHPEVRKLACEVIRQREARQTRMAQLMGARGIHPQRETAIPHGGEPATAARQVLHGRWGMSLDRGYLEHHHRTSQWLIEAVDGSFAQSARDPELREFFAEFRSELTEQIETTEGLQSSLVGWHM